MEEAEHALWRAAGLSIAPADGAVGFPRVAATVEYKAPLHFEDEFEVLIRIASLSKRSIKYEATVSRGDTTIATGTLTAACVRKHPPPMQTIDIPEDIAARLRMP